MALIEKLEAIGDAIRAKTGGTELLTLDAMPTEIAAIETGGAGEDTGALESVIITGRRTSRTAFPDLTPYISDLAQIEMMVWVDRVYSGGSNLLWKDRYYLYIPSISESIIVYTGVVQVVLNMGAIQETVEAEQDGTFTLGGTAAEVKVINNSLNTQETPYFMDELRIYYKGE